MKYQYQELTIKSTIEIIQLHQLEIRESLNQHTNAVLSGICTSDANEAVTGQKITISDGENGTVFVGRIHELKLHQRGGVIYFELCAYSISLLLDCKPLKRVIQNQSRTYRRLLELVVEPYHAFFDGGTCLDSSFPSLLVQNQETDWEFIKRLASQMGKEVSLNSASEQVQFFVGLTGEKEELTNIRFWKKSYQFESGKEILYIKTRKRYHPGYSLYFHGKWYYVKTCDCCLVQGEIAYCMELVQKTDGCMASPDALAQEGIRLSAEVNEIKGNQIRLYFENEAFSESGEHPWFPYYSEGNNEICFYMPTKGTRVEVLCTDLCGNCAIVTGAMRRSLKPSTVKDAADKAMKNEQENGFAFGETGIQIQADESNQIKFLKDGTVVLKAHQICLEAENDCRLDSLNGHFCIEADRKMSVFVGKYGCGQILFDTGGNIRVSSSTGLRYKSGISTNKSSRDSEKTEEGMRERTMAAAGAEFLAQSVSGVKTDVEEHYIKNNIFNNNERKFCAFSYGENKNGG